MLSGLLGGGGGGGILGGLLGGGGFGNLPILGDVFGGGSPVGGYSPPQQGYGMMPSNIGPYVPFSGLQQPGGQSVTAAIPPGMPTGMPGGVPQGAPSVNAMQPPEGPFQDPVGSQVFPQGPFGGWDFSQPGKSRAANIGSGLLGGILDPGGIFGVADWF